ncbi:hypothetical protein RHOSPDRAFT_31738 [Rhodotorula sp. JG-1b]|nr:hypothetical protein RHOSPDRAFT_31738 [Rhodotorula sp. JG-1b]
MEEIAAAGPRKRKIMAKAARMAIQQVRKETGRDEHGRLLRKKGSIDTKGSIDPPEDPTNEDNTMERVKVPLDECLKNESNLHPSETLEEHLESTRIAEITGRAPEEVQMKRREAELAGKDFEDVVAAAAAANPSDRSTVKDTARTTVEAAVEPTVGVIGKTTKKGKEPETAALCEE